MFFDVSLDSVKYLVDVKFFSMNMPRSRINPENPPRLPHEISTLAQDCKAWKRMEVDCWHHWEPP